MVERSVKAIFLLGVLAVFLATAECSKIKKKVEKTEESYREPKLGFSNNSTIPAVSPFIFDGSNGLGNLPNFPTGTGMATAIVTQLFGVKNLVLQLFVSVGWILFLFSGAAYFICKIFSGCGLQGATLPNFDIGGHGHGKGTGSMGYPAPSPPSNSYGVPSHGYSSRSYLEAAQPVYKALSDAYEKYGTVSKKA